MSVNKNQPFSVSETPYPPYFINGYINAQLKRVGILSGLEQMVPIFPTSPTNIEDVFRNYINAPGVSDPLLIQYERLVRYRPNYFYPIKREQQALYLYSTNLSNVIDAQRVLVAALDREDAAAQDVNEWASSNVLTDEKDQIIPHNVFFHCFKVFQVDEARDVMELASARTVFANKLIIEYDYHAQDALDSLYT